MSALDLLCETADRNAIRVGIVATPHKHKPEHVAVSALEARLGPPRGTRKPVGWVKLDLLARVNVADVTGIYSAAEELYRRLERGGYIHAAEA